MLAIYYGSIMLNRTAADSYTLIVHTFSLRNLQSAYWQLVPQQCTPRGQSNR